MDFESEIVREKSKKTLETLLRQIREDCHGSEPTWIIEMAHSKVFETSKLLSDYEFVENLFHETKTLEKHLATVHGFLWVLKAIEKARYQPNTKYNFLHLVTVSITYHFT